MFGKWEILEICGGIAGCVEVENFYYLFEKEKQTIYNEGKIQEKPVLKWRKNEKGCEVLLGDEDEQSIILEKIVNDTLYFSSVSGAGISVFVYTGIKVD
ncbi:MAG: hypothetical protein LUD02_00440 [Tannerellaceae bacterium]|nr:hypothetical protein [Tannerellaceae bacterium]